MAWRAYVKPTLIFQILAKISDQKTSYLQKAQHQSTDVKCPILVPKHPLKARKKAHRSLHTQMSSRDHGSSMSTATPPPPVNSLSGLPAEIKHAIFESLPNIKTLRALILTCPSFYYTFRECESLILAKVLQNQIHPSLMDNALATLQSSRMTIWNKETVNDLFRLYTSGGTLSQSPRWGLRDASILSETHGHVQFFANSFATHALSHNPVIDLLEMKPNMASLNELIRIERSLYRFQFFCALSNERMRFQGHNFRTFVVQDQEWGRLRFRGFTPWENEQLACICSYLAEIVYKGMPPPVFPSRAFRHLTRPAFGHGSKDSYQRSSRGDWYGEKSRDEDPYKYISRGLPFLHKLALAKEQSECDRILGHRSYGVPEFINNRSGNPFGRSFKTLQDMTEEQKRDSIPPHSAHDEEPGPETAWRWANTLFSPPHSYGYINVYFLRAWGYVMWDSARLVDSGILQVKVEELRTRPHVDYESDSISRRTRTLLRDTRRALYNSMPSAGSES